MEAGLIFLREGEEVGLTIVDEDEDDENVDDEDEDDKDDDDDGKEDKDVLRELPATMFTNVPNKKTKVTVKVVDAIF